MLIVILRNSFTHLSFFNKQNNLPKPSTRVGDLIPIILFYVSVWGAGQESANGSANSSGMGLGGAIGNFNQPTTSPPGPPLTPDGSIVPHNSPPTVPFFPAPVQPKVTSICNAFR